MIKRVKTKWWSFLHGNPRTYSVIGSTLYRPKKKYLEEEGWPKIRKNHLGFFKGTWIPMSREDHRIAAILTHEQIHYLQQKMSGVCSFWWMTRHDKKFLLVIEKEAYESQIFYMLDTSWKPTEKFIEAMAKNLLHESYGGMISEDQARAWVVKVIQDWKEAQDE